jgi:hypothetical protein
MKDAVRVLIIDYITTRTIICALASYLKAPTSILCLYHYIYVFWNRTLIVDILRTVLFLLVNHGHLLPAVLNIIK